MVPPAARRSIQKTKEKSAARTSSPLAPDAPIAALEIPLRKAVGRAADTAGEILEEATALSGASLAANFATFENLLAEKTVSVKEAAFRLGKSPDAIYNWLRSGRLRGRQPGGRGCAILVLESSVNDALRCSFPRAGAGRGAVRLSLAG
ncbi:MAG: helix-turn-helix domain-containing protein [Acidobacteria bacterium]|nr:helix-turn-helix domain-containing protein [Acidobacteriota bacterium]